MDQGEVTTALAEVTEMLRLGGYGLRVAEATPSTVDLTIVPEADACVECLVPEDIMRTVVDEALAPAGLSAARITYPE